MKNLYVVGITGLPDSLEETEDTPDVGEVQGVFDENHNLLDYWFSNDADLRVEYHKGVFDKLGYTLQYSPGVLDDELQLKLYTKVREDQTY